ncbi:MAG: SprB repeat-containing protein [Sphingobacteriales bacterium]|nr:MAG: SprB repeat-containing protein [Sphingobacteriales bacterium]
MAGTYSVTVTDEGECTATISVTVDEPEVLSMTGTVTNVTITNGNDGTIDVSVTGGTTPYSYLWSDGATTQDRTGLTAGTYSVTVTDANDCADEASFTLTEPPCGIVLNISAEDALCNGDANGSINLTITGTQGAVSILWNDGATSEDRTGLSAGTYSVTVTDEGECTATISVTVDEPEVLSMTGTVTNVTITNGNDGTINVSVTGGTTPYSYLWSDGATTQDRTGLPAGTYSVTVTDANDCADEASFTLTEPPCGIVLNISAEDALCNGDANGSIDLTITGTQGSVSILWNDSATTEDRTGLVAGTYSVTVTDEGECTATISVTVDEPEVLNMTGTVTNVTITNGSDGTIDVSVTGGTTPYSYLWSDGATTQDRTGLTAGTYSVTVTDANDCADEASFTLTEPPCGIVLNISAEDALCNGDANGSIDLTITGTQGAVSILWNDGATTEDRTGLTAGTYSVTVTDEGECTATISVTVDEPEVLSMTGTVTNVTITNGSNGTINVTVTGGTLPYSYIWSDGAVSQDRIGLPAGTYSVTVTDANGCTDEASFTLTEPGCELLDAGIVVVCNDNGTTYTQTDDYFNVLIHPTGNGLSNTYSVSGDITANNISYGVPYQVSLNYLITGGNLIITITDDISNSCQLLDVPVIAPGPCSNCPVQICVPVSVTKN